MLSRDKMIDRIVCAGTSAQRCNIVIPKPYELLKNIINITNTTSKKDSIPFCECYIS